MDVSVIKEQLGNFKTFVSAINDLLENFPKFFKGFAGVVDGDVNLFGKTLDYKDDDGKNVEGFASQWKTAVNHVNTEK